MGGGEAEGGGTGANGKKDGLMEDAGVGGKSLPQEISGNRPIIECTALPQVTLGKVNVYFLIEN